MTETFSDKIIGYCIPRTLVERKKARLLSETLEAIIQGIRGGIYTLSGTLSEVGEDPQAHLQIRYLMLSLILGRCTKSQA